MDDKYALKYLIEEEHKAINNLLDILDEKDLEINLSSKHTIRDRLRHMTRSEYSMAQALLPKRDAKIFEVDRDSTIETFRKKFSVSKERHIQTIKGLDIKDWDEPWKSISSGKTYTYGFMFWHFLEHLATHRGQIEMARRQYHEIKNDS